MNVYETLINSIATDVATKAESILMERMKAVMSGSGMIAKLLIETEAFKEGVANEFEKFIDENHEFKSAVEQIAENASEEAAYAAIREHERDHPHIDEDDILGTRDFEMAVETVINEGELNSSVDGIKHEVTDLQKWIKDFSEDDGAMVARLLAILVRPEYRKPLLRVLATGELATPEIPVTQDPQPSQL